MGSGKGSPEFWVTRIKPVRIMFEIDGVPKDLACAPSSWPRQAAIGTASSSAWARRLIR